MAHEIAPYDRSVDFALAAWMDEKRGLSDSKKTEQVYLRTMNSFRQACLDVGIDLDGTSQQIALLAQAWAGRAGAKEPASATYNQRLAVVSSFYEYCLRQELLGLRVNPIRRIKKRSVQNYGRVQPLDTEMLRTALRAIPRETLVGKRDYALLLLALTTGRRLSEVRNVCLRDFVEAKAGLTVTFERTKGGKTMRDTLSQAAADALRNYLEALAEAKYGLSSDAPIWLSLARNKSHGYSMSVRAIEDVCERRMGTSRFHALRHSFAHMMEEAGAKTSEIQARLGHASIATTGIYLAALRSDENTYATELASQLGL